MCEHDGDSVPQTIHCEGAENPFESVERRLLAGNADLRVDAHYPANATEPHGRLLTAR